MCEKVVRHSRGRVLSGCRCVHPLDCYHWLVGSCFVSLHKTQKLLDNECVSQQPDIRLFFHRYVCFGGNREELII